MVREPNYAIRSVVTQINATEAAVLALLAIEGERSRYDLMKSLSKAIGYIWAPAKTQLYALLPKLAERGLATSRTVREGARPEKKLFKITSAGRVGARPLARRRARVGGDVLPPALRRRARRRRRCSLSTSSGSASGQPSSSMSTGRSSRRTPARTTTSSTTSCSASASSARSTCSAGRTGCSTSSRRRMTLLTRLLLVVALFLVAVGSSGASRGRSRRRV